VEPGACSSVVIDILPAAARAYKCMLQHIILVMSNFFLFFFFQNFYLCSTICSGDFSIRYLNLRCGQLIRDPLTKCLGNLHYAGRKYNNQAWIYGVHPSYLVHKRLCMASCFKARTMARAREASYLRLVDCQRDGRRIAMGEQMGLVIWRVRRVERYCECT
jgi:hypothetical protein